MFFHIANTVRPIGRAGIGYMVKLKRMGLKAGIPDLCIIYNGRAFFIELKTPKGVLSQVQKERQVELAGAGAHIDVCRSVDDVRETLKYFLIPTIEKN